MLVTQEALPTSVLCVPVCPVGLLPSRSRCPRSGAAICQASPAAAAPAPGSQLAVAAVASLLQGRGLAQNVQNHILYQIFKEG